MLIDAIYSLLSTVNANTYPGVADQEVKVPFIVHAVAKTIPHPSKDGESTMDIAIYKIASYHDTQRGAQIQADSIRSLLDEYSGVQSSVYIDNIRFLDEENGYDAETDFYFTLQTYKIWINFNT
jgi:hypothetical protein